MSWFVMLLNQRGRPLWPYDDEEEDENENA
jgi:hypothetical protein